MSAMLWTIVVILVVLWALGLFTHVAGGLIHLLLVIAVILFVVNLIRGQKAGQESRPRQAQTGQGAAQEIGARRALPPAGSATSRW